MSKELTLDELEALAHRASLKEGGLLKPVQMRNAYIVCAVCRDEILTDL